MSWSVFAVGKAEAVTKKAAADFKGITYLPPEEALVKDATADLVAKTLSTQRPDSVIRLETSGSMSTDGDKKSHSVSVKLEAIHGFTE
jgi:hypothetical protein